MGQRTALLLAAALCMAGNPLALAEDPMTAPAPKAIEPLPFPAALSMPWRTPGIDRVELALARPALATGLDAMRTSWLTSPASLTTLLSPRPPTLNRKQLTDTMATGISKTKTSAPSIVAEPTWCSLMDRHVFFVTIADTRLGTLLGSEHVTIPRDRWATLGKGQGPFLANQLPKLTLAALAKAATKASTQPTDALHIGLSLADNHTRRDEGSSHCLAMLLEEQLAPAFTIARNLGADHLATVRDALGQPSAMRRPTRGLVLDWSVPAKPRKLPTTMQLNARLAETVFGRHVPITHQSSWTFSVDEQDRIAFTVDPTFRTLLTDEGQSLVLADLPQVAKVDRAWVYLDRGRAWGLRMNDRLVADVGGDSVKGHVVRFFGPEEGLTSPRGFPIREGAIVYIRKNQAQAAKGMTFAPDPREYPTAYPIPPGK